ncbi:replication protein A subunit RPA32 [Fomitopsis betulina]|nr:replication protein A subunit RPA32 [Fomitopsis betulina]KAI0736752.1 replication protein A subunit RPA32 [Fomitopsis betulina]
MSQQNENPYYGSTGGGYMAGGSPFGSANGSPGGQLRRAASQHSLRPVTIRQLLNATQANSDTEWMIDDNEIGQITVVAQVVSINSQTTNCVYWLDDGSGRVEARHWVDAGADDDAERWGGIIENVYVRAVGSLKSFGNKRYINATHLHRIRDHNEVNFHFLEAFTIELIFQKGPPLRPSEAGSRGAIANDSANASAYDPPSSSATRMEPYAHLPSIQRRIVEFMMNQPQQSEGIHVAAIARHIGGDGHAISAALDHLMDEGHVFTTMDDSHFALST